MSSSLLVRPGTLWPAVENATRRAVASGAMQPIETVQETVEDAGVRFIVRCVSSLVRKQTDQHQRGLHPANPFLPHEPDLFVADVSPTHIALLNKFNVIDRHLLIVTRRFVHQETVLDRDDFTALAACMAEGEALGFYNGGITAGASQPHKHLQMVPLPLAEGAHPTPVDAIFATVPRRPGFCTVPRLPFRHTFAWLEPGQFSNPLKAAAHLEALYLEALGYVGVAVTMREGERRQSAPYNLLVTRRWLLAVPRVREHFDSISVNALAFAGSLFVRDRSQLETVKRAGPMNILRTVVEG